jgi:hypothetical protein
MYFQAKNTLKNNIYHTSKLTLSKWMITAINCHICIVLEALYMYFLETTVKSLKSFTRIN